MFMVKKFPGKLRGTPRWSFTKRVLQLNRLQELPTPTDLVAVDKFVHQSKGVWWGSPTVPDSPLFFCQKINEHSNSLILIGLAAWVGQDSSKIVKLRGKRDLSHFFLSSLVHLSFLLFH